MFSKNEVAGLLGSLEASEKANNAFNELIDQLSDLMHLASQYRCRQQFDPLAMYEYANKLECVITCSGHDERVIKMCGVMLGLTGVSDREFKLGSDGKVAKRQVYFARRSDGLIKIGSSMRVDQRLEQLSAGAAEDLEILGHVDGSTLFEKALHNQLSKHRKYGEWFYPTPEVVDCIEGITKARRE